MSGARKLTAGAGCAFVTFTGLLALLVIGAFTASNGDANASSAAPLAPGTVPAAYQALIDKAGHSCAQLSPPLLAAQLYQESGFDPRAVSSAPAYGIAQFTAGTWRHHGVDGDGDGVKDYFDPKDAIPAAADYDCYLARRVASQPGDRTRNMLAAYNAGPDAVLRYHGVPPYAETRHYVASIESLVHSFAARTTRVGYSGVAAGAIYYAESKIGTPYLWGGTGTAAEGGRFDCSGLTQAAYASVGITLPRVANDQWYAGPHPTRSQLQPGDLVFFATNLDDPRTIHHVGIYVGGGLMLDAPHTGASIRFDPIDQPDYIGATRPSAAGAAALPTRNAAGQVTKSS